MATYRYKVVQVEAHQLSEFNTNDTVQIPAWVLDALSSGRVATGAPDTDWLVKKPDASVGVYSQEEFEKEFEKAELT